MYTHYHDGYSISIDDGVVQGGGDDARYGVDSDNYWMDGFSASIWGDYTGSLSYTAHCHNYAWTATYNNGEYVHGPSYFSDRPYGPYSWIEAVTLQMSGDVNNFYYVNYSAYPVMCSYSLADSTSGGTPYSTWANGYVANKRWVGPGTAWYDASADMTGWNGQNWVGTTGAVQPLCGVRCSLTKRPATVTINPNGGSLDSSNSTQTITCKADETFTIGNPTRTGYVFKGWKVEYTYQEVNDENGYQSVRDNFAPRNGGISGSSIGSGTTTSGGFSSSTLWIGNCRTVTLTAQWSPYQHTVAYNANGGSGAPSSQTKTYGSSLTLSSTKPTRTGYTFTGWNTASNGTGTGYSAGAAYGYDQNGGTVTLYAQWTPNNYTCTFNANGGTLSGSATHTFTYDSTANCLGRSTASRTGYTFLGWYTAASGGTKVFDANGDWYNKNANSASWSGWKTGTDWWYGSSRTAKWVYASNLTVYAHWQANTYTIKFNGNGSTSGSTASVSCTYDTAATLTANGFSRTGFTFKGWNTKSDGTGTSYADKASVKNLTSTNGGVVTLYAKWQRNQYTVTYNCTENGGNSNFTAKVYYDYNIDFSKTATKTGDTGIYSSSNKDGWQFVGWNTNKNATTGLTSMKMPAGNVTLYAIYKKTITARFKQYEYTGADTCANVSSVTNTTKSATVYNKTTTATLNESIRKSITGWVCDGWTTGTGEKAGLTTNFTISQDTQYYMRYSRYVQADFVSERTTVSLGGTRYRNSANINSSSPIALTTPAMKSKTGWTQVGWTTSKKANASASVKQKTAYALYDYITFYGVYTKGVTVSYDANGGESTPVSSTKTAYYNTAGNVLYPTFVTASPIHKNAVAFKNWNTEANGSGTAFESDTSVVFQNSQKLYATFDNIDVTGVVFDTSSLSLLVGESKKVTATVEPATATHENIIYESEDTGIATVDTTGNVTGVSNGVTNIVARSADNPDASAACQVVVSSGSVSVPDKLVLGSQGKITLKNNSTSGAKSSLYLAGLSNLVGVESGKEYSLVFDVLNGTEAETKAVDDVVVSTTSEESILFTVHPNVALSSLLPDKYNATIRYKLVIER